MKKTGVLLTSLVMVLMLICITTSCLQEPNYEENLGPRYDIETVDVDYYNYYISPRNKLDFETYEVETMMLARHKVNQYSVFIIHCKSHSAAEELASDILRNQKSNSEYDNPSEDFDLIVDGSVILFGDEKAIEDAQGE